MGDDNPARRLADHFGAGYLGDWSKPLFVCRACRWRVELTTDKVTIGPHSVFECPRCRAVKYQITPAGRIMAAAGSDEETHWIDILGWDGSDTVPLLELDPTPQPGSLYDHWLRCAPGERPAGVQAPPRDLYVDPAHREKP